MKFPLNKLNLGLEKKYEPGLFSFPPHGPFYWGAVKFLNGGMDEFDNLTTVVDFDKRHLQNSTKLHNSARSRTDQAFPRE